MCLCFGPDEAEVGFFFVCLFACLCLCVFPLLETEKSSFKGRQHKNKRYALTEIKWLEHELMQDNIKDTLCRKIKDEKKNGVNFTQIQQLTDSFHQEKKKKVLNLDYTYMY